MSCWSFLGKLLAENDQQGGIKLRFSSGETCLQARREEKFRLCG